MGGPLSVTLSNIYLTKLEIDCVKPQKPKLYKRFVDDVISKRNTNDVNDNLLHSINTYHTKINFTTEHKPTKFLDTEMRKQEGKVIPTVYRKLNKLLSYWTSKVPKRYKRSTINVDLSRAHRISSNFQNEISSIRRKYTQAGYSTKFKFKL